MVVGDISHSTTKDISISVTSTTPSVGKHYEPATLELMEEVRGEADILEPTKEIETNDCVMNKKQLRCEKHDCAIKVLSVSNRKWQWIEKKKQYGYVTRKSKKYRCMGRSLEKPDKSVNQVQLTVPKNVGMVEQTKEYYEEGTKNSGVRVTSMKLSRVGISDNTARKGEFLRARPEED